MPRAAVAGRTALPRSLTRRACARTPKEIACKYFYDAAGSRLFDAICALPEYYQTRTEVALLRRHAGEIAAPDRARMRRSWNSAPAPCARSASCWMRWNARAAIRPIDISGAYLREVVRAPGGGLSRAGAAAGGGRFHPAAAHSRPARRRSRRAGFFPGSTIGNFTPDAAMALLRRMREMLNGGGLLIGVDLVKDPALLHAAYNDAAGVTAAVQQESAGARQSRTGRRFRPGRLSPITRPTIRGRQRIEMYLVSLKRQSVRLAAQHFEFAAGEAGAYRGQPQIHHRKLPRDGGAGRLQSPRGVDRRGPAVLRMHWLESR